MANKHGGLVWVKASPSVSPCARSFHSAISYENSVILFGGTTQSQTLSDVWIFNSTTIEWEEVHPNGAVIARSHHTAERVESNMVVIGGTSGNRRLADVSVLDLDTWTWSTPTMGGTPVGLTSHTCTIIPGTAQLLVVGRQGGVKMQRRWSDVFVLDFSSFSWGAGVVSTVASRSGHSTIIMSINKAMVGIVFGGRDSAEFEVLRVPQRSSGNSTKRKVRSRSLSLPHTPGGNCFVHSQPKVSINEAKATNHKPDPEEKRPTFVRSSSFQPKLKGDSKEYTYLEKKTQVVVGRKSNANANTNLLQARSSTSNKIPHQTYKKYSPTTNSPLSRRYHCSILLSPSQMLIHGGEGFATTRPRPMDDTYVLQNRDGFLQWCKIAIPAYEEETLIADGLCRVGHTVTTNKTAHAVMFGGNDGNGLSNDTFFLC